MKVILSVPDEGYSERTWWRLFWVYLMKVIPDTRRAHYIWYLRFYFYIMYPMPINHVGDNLPMSKTTEAKLC
jgi:hypothetical protein